MAHIRASLVVSWSILTVSAFAGRVAAQSIDTAPSIRVSVHATVQATPDRADIDIGVITRAPRSQPAAAENAEQSSRAFAAVRKVLGDDANIRSVAYSIRPIYRQPDNARGGLSRGALTQYEVRNLVRVTLDDLTKIDEVIDAAIAADANRIEGVRLGLRDEAQTHADAVRQAAAAARARAETLAAALGVRITRVLSASEESSPVRPFAQVNSLQPDRTGTPIEIGTIDIPATVTLVVEISASAPPG